MAFSTKPQVEKIPMMLSLLHLELLIASCRRQDFHLSFMLEVTAPFRYELHQAQPLPGSPLNMVCILRSNDMMDVARFLGLDIHMQEPGFPNTTSNPTERRTGFAGEVKAAEVDEEYVSGPVPLKQGVPTPLVTRELSRKDNGQLDYTSPRFRDRCHALRVKSGEPLMECKKALAQADGDGDQALNTLTLPRRYSSTI